MKVQLLELMEDLIPPRKNLVITLVKQTQNFAWVYIKILIIDICLSTMRMFIFQPNGVSEVFLIDLVLLNLDKYL